MCTLTLIVAFFTIARTWRQPKVLSDKEDRVYTRAYAHSSMRTHTHMNTHTQEYYSAIEKNGILPL